MTNYIDEAYTVKNEDGTDVYRYVSDGRIFYRNTTFKAENLSVDKPSAKPKSRVSEKDHGIAPIDVKTVPEHLRFMCTEGFKDQAKEFYHALQRVQPSSDRDWVRKYYVNKLDAWSHIERANTVIGGLISQAMAVIADHPHFPTWWRSFGVYLMRGNPEKVIEACENVINFDGNKKVFIESEDNCDPSTMSY